MDGSIRSTILKYIPTVFLLTVFFSINYLGTGWRGKTPADLVMVNKWNLKPLILRQ